MMMCFTVINGVKENSITDNNNGPAKPRNDGSFVIGDLETEKLANL